MLKYVIICSFVGLCVSNSSHLDEYLEEGEKCFGLDDTEGQCLEEIRCFSALDKLSERLPRCLGDNSKNLVCCSDCEIVDDTNNALISPTGGTFWKTGNKARDTCIQYLKDLPYKCRETVDAGVLRGLDKENKCHTTTDWAISSTSSDFESNRTEYPHQALLGYGDTIETAEWLAGGSIISDRYILTAGHVGGSHGPGKLRFVALGVLSFTNPSAWQVHRVKRFIENPDYRSYSSYSDIALIETEEQITFTENVLPACLPVEKMNVTEAVATTWWDLTQEGRVFADTIQTIKNVEPFPMEICNNTYSKNYFRLFEGFKNNIQMCFGSKKNPTDSCRGLSGEPLLINTQISSCVYTIFGITSFGAIACGPTEELEPEVYTRVSFFVPWIESVVWPDL